MGARQQPDILKLGQHQPPARPRRVTRRQPFSGFAVYGWRFAGAMGGDHRRQRQCLDFELCHATVRSANFAELAPKLPPASRQRPHRTAGRLSPFAVERLGELLDSMR
jgi:hypothetical protein